GEHADRCSEVAVRPVRGVPRPEGQPELPAAARGVDGHRGPHRLRAAVLQRHRVPLQHQDPELPGQHPRRPVPLRGARVLPCRRRGAWARRRRVLIRPALPVLTRSPVYDQVAANKRRSWLLVAGFVVFVAVVAVAFTYLIGSGGPVGIVIALVIAAATSFVAYWKSDAVALRVSRAREASVDEKDRKRTR